MNDARFLVALGVVGDEKGIHLGKYRNLRTFSPCVDIGIKSGDTPRLSHCVTEAREFTFQECVCFPLAKAELGIGPDISFIPPKPQDLHPQTEPIHFRLPNMKIGYLERLLAVSDLSDLRLMYCMLCDYSYEETASLCFLSVETAKYRTRKIREMLHADNKAEAVELLKRYIKKETLLEVIKEKEHSESTI